METMSILASAVSPLAVVAIPTKPPFNTLKVAIPEGLLIFEGSLSFNNVPLLILDALIPVIFVPNPENEYDVVIPDTFKLTFTFKLELTVVIPLIYKFLPIITSPPLLIPTLLVPAPT